MSQVTPRATRGRPRSAAGAVGRRVPSKVGRKLVMGAGAFVDDIHRPRMLHARFVRSPHAHARVVSIDTSAAEAMAGVALVWTAEDIEPYANRFAHNSVDPPDEEALASERVRYHGDEVAVVLASDRNTAIEAAERVDVTYERLPVVLTTDEALAADAPLVHPELDADPASEVDGNILHEFTIGAGDVSAALDRADVVVGETFHTNKTNAHPLEPRGCVAEYNPGSETLTVWSSHQAPHLLKATLARAIEPLDERHIVCRMPEIGGGFGQKIELFSHEVCAAALAVDTGRPIKFVWDRLEECQAGRGRNETRLDARVGLTAEGDIVAWEVDMVQNTGAYGSYGKPVAFSSAVTSMGPYRIPHQRIAARIVYTNKMPTSAYRGYGDPQFSFAREQLIDMAAEELGFDPVQLRLRNLPTADEMPITTPKGLVLEAGDAPACLRRVRELLAEDAPGRRGGLRGVGVAAVLRRNGNRLSGAEKQPEGADEGLDTDEAIVKMSKDGDVDVLVGITSIGQGTETGVCQIVADVLGVSVDRVTPHVGSTDLTPYGMGVWADRGATIGGTAAARAAEDLKGVLVELAAHRLGVDPGAIELDGGRAFVHNDPANGLPIEELAFSATFGGVEDRPVGMEDGVSLVGRGAFDSRATESPLDVEAGHGSIAHSYTLGALGVVVDVDPGTGSIEPVDVAFVEDAGTILNPTLVEGQAQGAIGQALGETFLEEYAYDDTGRLQNGTLIDYHLPTAADVPLVTKLDEVETPSPSSSHGQKGVGETPTPITAAAVANAVYDATGIRFTELPLSASRVLPALVERGLVER